MGLNDTPLANRIHIGFFGMRNAGKSSVVNSVTSQNIAVVSDTKGTTTDPVYKSMELLPMGPVVVIDTPGFDDEGELGKQRVDRTRQVLNKSDVAVLVCDATVGLQDIDRQMIDLFTERGLPFCIAFNKCDLLEKIPDAKANEIYISASDGINIYELKNKISVLTPQKGPVKSLVGDLIAPGDLAVLVVPIDKSAPKGRLILPQQQVIRDVLDADARAIIVRENRVRETLLELQSPPAIVITDSQAFESVAADTPSEIPLTSFSILMARYKGYLNVAVNGASAISKLEDEDTILISEGCTHHRQCEDIGTVKLPAWLKKYTGKNLIIETSSGTGFPENLKKYSLIIHCGACMLNGREVMHRMKLAEEQNIPITNYGIAIAYMKGILERSINIIPEINLNTLN